jgi:alpha-mannosidase
MPAPRHEIEIFRGRFPRFLATVIEPAIYRASGPGVPRHSVPGSLPPHSSSPRDLCGTECRPAPLDIEAWQTPDPVPFAEAARAEYRPVPLGWRWGPPWSTCWFRLRGVAPADPDGLPLDLRFSTRTECTVWIDGRPRRGLDINRDSYTLTPRPAPGSPVEIFIEAACNHPFGVSTFDWDTSDTHDRWRSAEPGHLLLAELAPRHENVRRLAAVYRFASNLLGELDPRSPGAGALYAALVGATQSIDDRAVAETADTAREILERALNPDTPAACPALGLAVAHAHIDTAWLWPLAETRRKVLRSWTNALEVLDRHPRVTFICSQAQQYARLESDAPEVFRGLADRVADGRFQPMGGMWVEPDANVPSAESLLRQILHADRYWRSRFGDQRGAQHTLYLPDTFGFPASLPDLMHAAGLDLFITNKMSWNQGTPYTHTNFRWRGLGGCEVLAHNTPNHDYNCTNTPRELRRITANLRGLPDGCPKPQPYLHPFGFGDGGGGPTLEQAETVDLAGNHPALAPLRHGSLAEFRDLLRELDVSLPGGLPIHEGEQYLELHRGTLTTHAWLKRANRELELALRLAEVLAFAAPSRRDAGPRHAERLDHAWKLLLLQQFHDILPGSSITRVYDDCRAHLAEIRKIVDSIMHDASGSWSSSLSPVAGVRGTSLSSPYSILNPASAPQSAVLEHAGEFHQVSAPALSISPLPRGAGSQPDTPPSSPHHPTHLNPSTGELSNGIISARIDRSGRIASLRLAGGPEFAESPLNRLALYRDIPMNWDAWDLDAYTEDEPLWINDTPAESWSVRTNHPLRVEIEVSRPIGDGSTITQVFRLDAGSPRLDIITTYRWDERHRLLRAEMPTAVRAPFATYDIQCGSIRRPTTRDTLAERMMFEVCAHRWMDLSEPGKGLALLNNGRYGHSCRGGVMGLSLLRAPRHPDPTAGRDEGSLTYSLMPHAGDWRAAGVDLEADRLNNPPRIVPVACAAPWSPVTITQAPGQRLDIAALKAAHDDPARLVLRLIETRGVAGRARVKWNLPVTRVVRADALEREIHASCAHAGDTTTIEIPPHGVVTLIAERA